MRIVCEYDVPDADVVSRGRVVLLHGIMSGHRSMRSLSRAFVGNGFEVVNIGYPSTAADLRTIALALIPRIEGFAGAKPVHFVTHSMGGLVVRVLLAEWRPAQLGRVVMIAPPNAGSEVADLMRGNALYRTLYGPAGQELVRARATTLPMPDYPVGILAGTIRLQLAGYLLFDGPNDGRVSVASAGLGPDFPLREVASSHPFVMRHREAVAQAIAFIRDGAFLPPDP
jgi:pimeloyl-ACP methyl ester carboxylesterase